MPLLIANINLLTALGITNKELFDAVFESFDDFDTFCHNSGYDYEFDDNDNLVIITPKSLKINTGIEIPLGPDKNYFCITALEDGTITFNASGVLYSNNGKDWETLTSNLIMTKDKSFWFKGTNKNYNAGDTNLNNKIVSSTCKFNVSGNIMSLFYGDNFEDKTTFPNSSSKNLQGFFRKNTNLVSAKDLILPATTMTDSCYAFMFYGCTSLTEAPELPATTLAENCYNSMFATCSSLTSAPELPAEILVTSCYGMLFYLCSSLTYIKMLATDISASYCMTTWVSGVAATGTFVKNSAAEWDVTGSSGIPSGWTVETADS